MIESSPLIVASASPLSISHCLKPTQVRGVRNIKTSKRRSPRYCLKSRIKLSYFALVALLTVCPRNQLSKNDSTFSSSRLGMPAACTISSMSLNALRRVSCPLDANFEACSNFRRNSFASVSSVVPVDTPLNFPFGSL